MPSLVEIGPVVLEKRRRRKCEKFTTIRTQTTTTTTDKFHSEKAHLGLDELKNEI